MKYLPWLALLPVLGMLVAGGYYKAGADAAHLQVAENQKTIDKVVELLGEQQSAEKAKREQLRRLCLQGKLYGDECAKVGVAPSDQPPRKEGK